MVPRTLSCMPDLDHAELDDSMFTCTHLTGYFSVGSYMMQLKLPDSSQNMVLSWTEREVSSIPGA